MKYFQGDLGKFQEWEIRTLLNEILVMTAQSADKEEGLENKLADGIIKLWKDRIDEVYTRQREAEELQRTTHLVFGLSDAGSLKVTLSNIGKSLESEVLAFNELFSIGPILNIELLEGQKRRQQWMEERFAHYAFYNLFNREHQIGHMIETIARIPERNSITIWCSDNAHDQMGLRFALYLLRKREQSVKVVNISEIYRRNSLSIHQDVLYYSQGVIPQETYQEIVSTCNEVKVLDPSRRRLYESEWLEISSQNDMLRIWQDGAIKGLKENELDGVILKAVTKLEMEHTEDGFVNVGKVMFEVFENLHQIVGDQFIEYRIWIMISNGILTFKGVPGAMYLYSIRTL
ncbi:DUF1835 domain-containing protein [Paenibacillus pini]|uniref:DUF1835 domain-containing protein n=1 Tax=Paenibacillus pini JCM 16418 TaxID=1236976 RepID=W7Z4M5_9BACL|nr:DUF1835 domain-containing protein [Paenibacillus pini]GAF09314.1 hypothetical protein JCM16418_3451 [Paenibacillus pini JCM 16418]